MNLLSKIENFLRRWYSPSLLACVFLLVSQSFDSHYCFVFASGLPFGMPVNMYSSTMIMLSEIWRSVGDYIVWLLFLCVVIGAIRKARADTDGASINRYRFVVLDLVVGLIAFTVPFISVYWDFYFHRNERAAVADLAQQRILGSSVWKREKAYELPRKFRHLSEIGVVEVADRRYCSELSRLEPETLHVFFDLPKSFQIEFAANDQMLPAKRLVLASGRFRKNWFWRLNCYRPQF